MKFSIEYSSSHKKKEIKNERNCKNGKITLNCEEAYIGKYWQTLA